MLAVVQDEQNQPAVKRGADRVNSWTTRPLTDVSCCGDRRTHPRGIRDRRQLDQPYPVGVAVEQVGREVKGEPRLSAAARAGQRQQACRLETLNRACELALSSNERRGLRGKVVWSRVETAEWREAVRQTIDDELID